MIDTDVLFADPLRLQSADGAALLPGAASAGAQLRAVAAARQAWERFDGFTPRAVVVVAVGRAAVDARLCRALLGSRISVPFYVSAELPAWVGALDAVIVLSPDPDGGRLEIVQAIEISRRRGAMVLVRSARFGPAAFAAGPDLYVPSVGVPEVLAGLSRIYLLLDVARACGLVPAAAGDEVEQLADLADAEALACSANAEVFVNPAKSLAQHFGAGSGILIGTDSVTAGVAAHAGAVFAELSSRPIVAFGPVEIAEATGVLRSIQTGGDLFSDPFDTNVDGESTYPSPQVAILQSPDAAGTEDGAVRALRAALDRVSGALTLASPPPPTALSGTLVGATVATAVSLLVRLDFAAVYLGLIDGQLTPLDSPAGLAPFATNPHHLRPEPVERIRTALEDLD